MKRPFNTSDVPHRPGVYVYRAEKTLSLAGREPGRPVRKALYLATNDPARPWLRFEFTGSVSPAKESEGR